MRMILVLRVAGGIICACSAFACFSSCMDTSFRRVDLVNSRLPVDRRFKPLMWWPLRKLRFEEQYKHFFPDRTLLKRERTLMAVGIVIVILGAVCIGPALP
jgi:hypothetical protein